MAALEKSLQVEKDFCKLKDKQMGDLQLKLQKLGLRWCKNSRTLTLTQTNYVSIMWRALSFLGNGWWHPDLDLSGLVMGDVEKELLSDHPSEATVENVMEETTTVAEVSKGATPITPTDPILDE